MNPTYTGMLRYNRYEDWENNIRIFSKEVALGCRASPWLECTNEEKEQWETEHNNEQLIEMKEELNNAIK